MTIDDLQRKHSVLKDETVYRVLSNLNQTIRLKKDHNQWYFNTYNPKNRDEDAFDGVQSTNRDLDFGASLQFNQTKINDLQLKHSQQ